MLVTIGGELVVWESFAISEYVKEAFPGARLWPGGREAVYEGGRRCGGAAVP